MSSTDTIRALTAVVPAKKHDNPITPAFTRLAELEIGERTNVCGVVVFSKEPRPTKNGDMMMLLRIVDKSYPDVENGITLNVFDHPDTSLIKPRGQGSIIIARHVRVQSYQGKPQIVSYKDCKLLTFDEALDAPIIPQPLVEMSETEIEAVKHLRLWWSEFRAAMKPHVNNLIPNQADTLKLRPTVTYSEVNSKLKFVNMTMQVLRVTRVKPELVVLHLADYTENKRNRSAIVDPTKDYLGIRPFRMIHTGQTLPTSYIFECTLWDEHAKKCLNQGISPYDYVYLDNVALKLNKDRNMIVGDIHGKTQGGITGPLPVTDTACTVIYQRRQAYLGRPCNPFDFVKASVYSMITPGYTRIAACDAPITPIRQVLVHPYTPCRFRLRSRFLKHIPNKIEQLTCQVCRTCGQSASQGVPMCKCEPVGLKWVFRFAIWLTDAPENARPHPKNTLRVFVYGDAAIQLLGGLLPTDFSEDMQGRARLNQQLALISTYRHRLTDWCIVSTTRGTSNTEPIESDPKLRDYHLFNTELLPQAGICASP